MRISRRQVYEGMSLRKPPRKSLRRQEQLWRLAGEQRFKGNQMLRPRPGLKVVRQERLFKSGDAAGRWREIIAHCVAKPEAACCWLVDAKGQGVHRRELSKSI